MVGGDRPRPPVYQYSNITSPVALFWSDGDILVVPRDVASLASSLPNLVTKSATWISRDIQSNMYSLHLWGSSVGVIGSETSVEYNVQMIWIVSKKFRLSNDGSGLHQL